MKPFTIMNLGYLLQASSDRGYRKGCRDAACTLARFIDTNGLSKSKLLGVNNKISDTFNINSSDLTSEGMELIKRCYFRWLASHDRGVSPTSTRMLERTLAQMRGTLPTPRKSVPKSRKTAIRQTNRKKKNRTPST